MNEKSPLLTERALHVREHIIGLAARGGCFIGAALSCVELLVYLYSGFLNVNRCDPDNPGRDYLFFSKGHAVAALYGTLAEAGFMPPGLLEEHLSVGNDIYWHPNRSVPGVEFHTGSLGHGLPLAVGVALDCKIRGTPNRVVVITGDGELNEGSNWEACLVASAYRLDNLLLVVDRNGFQANGRTEALIPLEPLAEKLLSFGCATRLVDGHDFTELHKVFSAVPFTAGRPSAVIALTVRGRGLPSLEGDASAWFRQLSPMEKDSLLGELHRVVRGG